MNHNEIFAAAQRQARALDLYGDVPVQVYSDLVYLKCERRSSSFGATFPVAMATKERIEAYLSRWCNIS